MLYMFYKNVLYVLPIFFYGIYNAFSGTNFYDLNMYNIYNIAFTGVPIGWFCMFDWQYEKQKFLQEPHLYMIGLKN